MHIYILLFITLMLLSILNIYIDKIKLINIYIIFSIFLLLFTGFRYYLGGSDYYVYKAYFDNMPDLQHINSLIKCFTNDSMWLFFIITLISLSVLLYFNYKYCKYPFFTLTFYFYKTFLYTNFVAMRQSIAIAIFIISIKYILDGNFKKYAISIFIASLFHTSSIVLIFLYFVRNIKLKKLNMTKILMIGISIMLLSKPIILIISKIAILFGASSTVQNKITNISSSIGINLHVIEIVIFYFIFARNYKPNNDNEKIIYNLFAIYTILLIGFSNYVIFIRISMYFYFIIMIFISSSLKKNSNLKLKQLQVYTLMLIFFIGYIKYLIQFDSGGLIPYKSFLFL